MEAMYFFFIQELHTKLIKRQKRQVTQSAIFSLIRLTATYECTHMKCFFTLEFYYAMLPTKAFFYSPMGAPY